MRNKIYQGYTAMEAERDGLKRQYTSSYKTAVDAHPKDKFLKRIAKEKSMYYLDLMKPYADIIMNAEYDCKWSLKGRKCENFADFSRLGDKEKTFRELQLTMLKWCVIESLWG